MSTSIAAKDEAIVLAEFLSSQLPTFFSRVFILFHYFLYFFMSFSLLPTLYFHFCLYFNCRYVRDPSSLLHFGGVFNIPDIREHYIWNKDGLWLVAESKNFKWIV